MWHLYNKSTFKLKVILAAGSHAKFRGSSASPGGEAEGTAGQHKHRLGTWTSGACDKPEFTLSEERYGVEDRFPDLRVITKASI